MFRKTPLAWLQVTREKTRLVVAIAGIAFADLLMFIQMGFESALYDAAVKPHRNLKAGLVLINPQLQTLFSVKSFSRLNGKAVTVKGLFTNGASFAADGNIITSDSTFSATISTSSK